MSQEIIVWLIVMNCNSKREELKSLVVSDYEKPDGQGQVEQQQAIDA